MKIILNYIRRPFAQKDFTKLKLQINSAMELNNWDLAAKLLDRLITVQGNKVEEQTYQHLLHSLRSVKRFDQAEVIAKKGLELFPSSTHILNHYSLIALKQKKWNVAIEQLERLLKQQKNSKARVKIQARLIKAYFQAGHSQKAADSYKSASQDVKELIGKEVVSFNILFAKQLYKQFRFDEAEDLIKQALKTHGPEYTLLKKFAQIAISQGDFTTAIKRLEEITNLFRDKTPEFVFNALFKLYNKIGAKSLAAQAISRSCDYDSKLAQKSYNHLIKGKKEAALRVFTKLLDKIYEDKESKALWLDSYFQISCLFEGDVVKPKRYTIAKVTYSDNKQIQKIMVSGMGWSGSSALYDYFKEFKQVQEVPGELRHIEGKVSLKTLWACIGNIDKFKKMILEFFAFTLFGYGVCYDRERKTCLNSARKIANFNNCIEYFRGVNLFCEEIKLLYLNKYIDPIRFRSAANTLINRIAAVFSSTDDEVCLFDNVIHINNISQIKYLDNTFLFCTFRDPRANYIALIKENPHFVKTIEEFVISYRKVRQQFERLYSQLSGDFAIYKVQFEEFVLSEDYRYSLAKEVGLDLELHSKHEHFKPWISEKNVFVYEDFPDQKAIKYIEAELSQYLWHS